MPKTRPNECRCWSHYPNENHKDKCQYYECIKDTNGVTRKTVCWSKEYKNKREEHLIAIAKELRDYCVLHNNGYECTDCVFKISDDYFYGCSLCDSAYFRPSNFDIEDLEENKDGKTE